MEDNNQQPLCQNYSEVSGKCNGKPMKFICCTGRNVSGSDEHGNTWGRSEMLFQCEDCKTIEAV